MARITFTPRTMGLIPWMLFSVRTCSPTCDPADPLKVKLGLVVTTRRWVRYLPELAAVLVWIMIRKGARNGSANQ